VHWLPEEVPLGEDCKDWATKLTDKERNLLTQIFRFFTQSDVEVGANYMENYMPLFKPVEVRMMLAAFSNMETVHIAAYALLLETIGMPDTEFSAFMEYEEMAAKHDYLGKFGVETEKDILTSMAVFGGFTEGLQLFAVLRDADELPALQQDEGDGPDRVLVGAR
jgi:ribonucleoside-diphosphate reductase beta chain